MLKKKRRQNSNEVNAGSMADIAFLLLIFFLVTTQIAEDKGILVKLPVWVDDPITVETNTDDVLSVKVNGKNELLVESEIIDISKLKKMTKEFISNPTKREDRPERPDKAVVSLQNDRSTSYETYIDVYNELKAAYRELRDEESLRTFGKPLAEINNLDQRKIKDKIPLVISEADPSDYFKEGN